MMNPASASWFGAARRLMGKGGLLRSWVLVLVAVQLPAAELHVMTSGTFTAAYLELKPNFERESRHTLVTDATSMGAGLTVTPLRVERGERADVLILDATALDKMIKAGLVRSDSRVDLVRSSIGMAVRAGAPRPDVSTVETLTATLLAAKSIAYSASVSGDYLSREVFPRLGIADKIREKSKRIEVERVGAVVARGDAEIGFQQVSELRPVPGIDLIGPLPASIQKVSVFAAGIPTAAKYPEEALAFIAFLASGASQATIEKTGLEPINRRK